MLPNPLEDIARRLVNYEKRLSHLERLEKSLGWELIEDIKLAAPAASFDFQNIPTTFGWLFVIRHVRGTGAFSAETVIVRFNNDGGNNYNFYQTVHFSPNTSLDGAARNTNRLSTGQMPAANSPANWFGLGNFFVSDYKSADIFKSIRGQSFNPREDLGTGLRLWEFGGLWEDTSAIDRITMSPASSPTFASGSRATLYGMRV